MPLLRGTSLLGVRDVQCEALCVAVKHADLQASEVARCTCRPESRLQSKSCRAIIAAVPVVRMVATLAARCAMTPYACVTLCFVGGYRHGSAEEAQKVQIGFNRPLLWSVMLLTSRRDSPPGVALCRSCVYYLSLMLVSVPVQLQSAGGTSYNASPTHSAGGLPAEGQRLAITDASLQQRAPGAALHLHSV